jgi:hypothetical protein
MANGFIISKAGGAVLCQCSYQQQGWWCGFMANHFFSSKAGGSVLWPVVLPAARLVVRFYGQSFYEQQGWSCGFMASRFTSSKAGGVL